MFRLQLLQRYPRPRRMVEYVKLIGSNSHNNANFQGKYEAGDERQQTRHKIRACNLRNHK